MKYFYRVVLVTIFSFSSIFAQSNINNFWNDVQESQITLSGTRYIVPSSYRTLSLDRESLKRVLETAPMEFSSKAVSDKVILTLPYPDGSSRSFYIVESPIMAYELAVKYPDIKTYAGKGIDDPASSIRFDLTPLGFHAIIFSPDGTVFIDPYSLGDSDYYISYYTRDYTKSGSSFECEVLYEENYLNELQNFRDMMVPTPTGPQLRTYRLAVAATGEYTTFYGGTVALGLSGVVTSVNRVNGVYEKEVAVRMILIANNNLLIFTNASTDPYSNTNGSAMLAQNQTTIDQIIGSANYDVGHVFSTGGGGVAYLGVICNSSYKAQGVTGSYAPVGDPFDIDYVAHEMGHQFGGNHSFNGNASSCGGGNRNPGTAYEPGSGSTIMSYAGICGSHNLQPHSDPYFHTVNFDEIVYHTNFGGGNNCAVITNTGNHAPAVTVSAGGFYIPKGTPFVINGSASDQDGDTVLYCWEEFDLGAAGHPNTPVGNAPIFRTFNPVLSSSRTFPKLSSLLNNTQVIGEILPSYTRNLTFRLVARDNRMGGGGVDYATIAFFVSGDAGPFLVSSPNTNVSWPALSYQTVTWDAANTASAPVNCANVNILLSIDGGQTYPFVLSSNTPNDGTQEIQLPDNMSAAARIKVEAVNNIFFDISNVNFTISETVPVELLSFSGYRVDEGIQLKWMTATELNNAGFVLERSRDNENFSEIGFREGKGTSTTANMYVYLDNTVESGVYYYRLKQIDLNGMSVYLNVIEIDAGSPKEFSLSTNYPNPFNPSTKFKYSVPEQLRIQIKVFDVLGNEVMTLVDDTKEAGFYELEFDASSLSSGIYYYRLTSNNYSETRKMILMK